MLRAASIDEVGHSMADDDQGSVTQWLGELKAGGRSAAEPLWYRYFERLVVAGAIQAPCCARRDRRCG